MKKKYNNFKKLISIIAIVILTGIIYMGVKINKDPYFINNIRTSLRTNEYFIKIEKDAVIEENKEDNPWIYKYETTAYNKKGEAINVSFYANKNLKKGAYICVHVGDTKNQKSIYGVDSFEEVNINNVPKQAKDKLDN